MAKMTPCDSYCGGWVCAFHGLPQEAQDEITSLRTRLEAAEKAYRDGNWDRLNAALAGEKP